MKRRIKTKALILSFALAFSVMCGCGSEPENVSADQPAEVSETEDPEEGMGDLITDEEQSADTEEETSVAEESDNASGPVYLDKMNELKSEGFADQFALADIDGDGSPELIASDSQGSYDHENAFIFTVYDGKCVQLASAISGVDGASLSYSEGKNLIRQSGAAAGEMDVYSQIKDGKLEEVFKAEMVNTLQMDENDEEIFTYSVNGEEVDEKKYTEAVAGFIKDYAPLIRIDYDGLNKITFKQEQDMGWFEQTETGKYSTEEEVTNQLENDAV